MRLNLENKSPGRIANYADNCIRILRICNSLIWDWSRADVERIHEAITDLPHANFAKKLPRYAGTGPGCALGVIARSGLVTSGSHFLIVPF